MLSFELPWDITENYILPACCSFVHFSADCSKAPSVTRAVTAWSAYADW